ncbi:MAG: DNA repair protein RecO [Patescibacteria group bacterium]
MRPRSYSSEGIVLARRNYGEADRILVIYSKNYGKLSLMAKGVRMLKSRKRGSLEVFSHINFSAARGKSLDIMTEAEYIDFYPQIRKNLNKVAVAYFFMETIGRVTQEGEKNEALYLLLLKKLSNLKTSKTLKNLRKEFIYEVLTQVGFWPRGKKLDNHDQVLEDVVEREMSSARVGKKLLS